MSIEYRICWSASTNISFRGATEWTPAEDPDASADDVERYLCGEQGTISDGLEAALGESGFEWWVETREV